MRKVASVRSRVRSFEGWRRRGGEGGSLGLSEEGFTGLERPLIGLETGDDADWDLGGL